MAITDKGREIIGKFLLGQVASYATHVSVGVGSTPTTSDDIFTIQDAFLGANLAFTAVNLNELAGDVSAYQFYIGQTIRISNAVGDYADDYNGLHTIVDIILDQPGTPYSVVIDTPPGVTPADPADPVLTAGDVTINYAKKQIMDFEAARFPISSKGFVTENINGEQVTKLSVIAQLPNEQRYLISEVGLWSAGSNSVALNSDSRILYQFGPTEGWYLRTPYQSNFISAALPIKTSSLDDAGGTGTIVPPDVDSQLYPTLVSPIFITNSDNVIFSNQQRVARQEPPRFLSNCIMFNGASSNIQGGVITSDSSYIVLDGRNINLSSNSPSDLVKISFSLVYQSAIEPTFPEFDGVDIVVEFLFSEAVTNSGYARLIGHIKKDEIDNSRYHIYTTPLSTLQYSTDFSWRNVRVTRVFASVTNGGIPTPEYYVAIDGIRFENISSVNPIYGMTGYSVVSNVTRSPILKIANTSSYVEFRFDVGVT